MPNVTAVPQSLVSARAAALLGHPDAFAAMRRLASGFIALHDAAPRASALFAVQQRWLMSHVAMALHFDPSDRQGGLTQQRFLRAVLAEGIASRNTAVALLEEALKYGIVIAAPTPGAEPRLLPSPASLDLLGGWYAAHLAALDQLDGLGRAAAFAHDPISAMAEAEPHVCRALLDCAEIREPGPAFSLFTWTDEGGALMDRLIAGSSDGPDPDASIFVTDVLSISALARSVGLSRSHAGRKLVAAEQLGLAGWTGRRGRSPMWISRGFRREYAHVQALKLAIIDAALRPVLAPADD